mmetsp:Transcript_28017/g.82378  ORF Transcript_28017/g.82378 Transcript_28017/m.82378 type:complete len:391 (-) Transcript_28017:51-1223(-)
MTYRVKPKAQQLPPTCHAWSISDFLIGETLGEGLYGKVVRGRFKRSLYHGMEEPDVAIKVVDKHTVMRKNTAQNVLRERQILSSIGENSDSDLVVRLHLSFVNEDALFFVMELCNGGDLAGLTKRAHAAGARRGEHELTGDAWGWAKHCSAQILRALECIHNAGVAHRDLKPCNIMFKIDGSVRIIDFGSALVLARTSSVREENEVSSLGPRALDIDSFVGTADFVAPEVIRGEEGLHSYTLDLWSYGCIFWSLFDHEGRSPFSSSTCDDISAMQAVLSYANGSVPLSFPSCMPSTAVDLARSLLNPVPTCRKGAFDGQSANSSEHEEDKAELRYSSIRGHAFFGEVDWFRIGGESLPLSPIGTLLPHLSSEEGTTMTDGALLNMVELLS